MLYISIELGSDFFEVVQEWAKRIRNENDIYPQKWLITERGKGGNYDN